MAVETCFCETCRKARAGRAPEPQTIHQLVTLQEQKIDTLERRIAALEARVGTGAEP